MKQLEEERSAGAQKTFVAEQVRRQQDSPQVGRLLLLYVDDTVGDATPFGNVRQRAYKTMPKDTLQITGQRMSVKPASKLAMHWQAVDGLAEPTDLRYQRQADRSARRPLRVLAVPADQEALQVGRHLSRRQSATPPLLRRTGLAGR